MLKLDKENNDYILAEYTDILTGLNYSSKKNDNNINELLSNLFVDSENLDVYIGNKHFVRLKKDSKVVKYLKEEVKIIDYDTFIDHNILKDALVRSYYEFNHEMHKELKIYFRKYVDNEIKGIDNQYIKDEIINNKKLLEYIKEYESLDQYLEKKINIDLDIKDSIKGKKKSMVG